MMLDRARALWKLAQAGHPVARLRVLRDGTATLRTSVLAAGITSGVLPTLAARPDGLTGLAARLKLEDEDLLEAFLHVLASAKSLNEEAGRWAPTRRARALLGDPVAKAAVVAYGGYYSDLYRHLPDQLRGGASRTDLDDHAGTIAAVSGAFQPLVEHMIRAVVEQTRPSRVLDVGCGTGDQLTLMLNAAPRATGIGIDTAPGVAVTAAQRLADAGLADRGTVLALEAADLASQIGQYGGPVDLMLLANVVYYVPPGEQSAFLATLLPILRPGGRLVIVNTVADNDLFTRHFDLLLRAQGRGICIPALDDLISALHDAGYASIKQTRLAPAVPVFALTATRSA